LRLFPTSSYCDRVDVERRGEGNDIPAPARNATDFTSRRANIWNVTGSFMVAPTLYRGPPPRIIYRVRVGDARYETHRQPASRYALSLFRKSGSPLSFPYPETDYEGKTRRRVSALGHPFCPSPSNVTARDGNKRRRFFQSRMFASHDKLFENIEYKLCLICAYVSYMKRFAR